MVSPADATGPPVRGPDAGRARQGWRGHGPWGQRHRRGRGDRGAPQSGRPGRAPSWASLSSVANEVAPVRRKRVDGRAEISVLCRCYSGRLPRLRSPAGGSVGVTRQPLGCRSGVPRCRSSRCGTPAWAARPAQGWMTGGRSTSALSAWERCSWRPSAPGRAGAAVRCTGVAGAGAAAGLAPPRATLDAPLSRSSS